MRIWITAVFWTNAYPLHPLQFICLVNSHTFHYIWMRNFRPFGARGIMFAGCPSWRPSIGPSVRLSVRPSVLPTDHYPNDRLSFRLPVPRGFRAFVLECMGGMVWKFGMLTNPVHLQNWLDFGHGLLIFLILVPLRLNETGKFKLSGHFLRKAWEEWPEIWHTDVSLPRRWTGGMVWNLTCCFSVITFRTDYISVTVCWFSSCWCHFDLVKLVIFEVSGYFHEITWE